MTTHNKMADFIMAHLFSLAVDRHKVTGFLPCISGNMAILSKPCMIKQQEYVGFTVRAHYLRVLHCFLVNIRSVLRALSNI